MTTDKIKAILGAVESAAVVTAGDSPYLHSADVDEPNGDPENEVLRFRWVDNGYEYEVKFTEGALNDARLNGHRITAEDHEGEPTDICLFDLMPKPVNRKAEIGDPPV